MLPLEPWLPDPPLPELEPGNSREPEALLLLRPEIIRPWLRPDDLLLLEPEWLSGSRWNEVVKVVVEAVEEELSVTSSD